MGTAEGHSGRGRGQGKWSAIRRPVTPERQARVDAIAAAMAEGERLFELRKGLGITQTEIASRLAVSQGAVSELERRDDLFISTLRGYVAALGGRLELSAVFDEDGRRQTIAVGAAVPDIAVLEAVDASGAAVPGRPRKAHTGSAAGAVTSKS